MSVVVNFPVNRGEDGTAVLQLDPPVNISGWSINFQVAKRLGGTGLINCYAASGYNNVSGIRVTNGAAGVLNVIIQGPTTSGWVPGPYAHTTTRTDSGYNSLLSEGFMLVNQSATP